MREQESREEPKMTDLLRAFRQALSLLDDQAAKFEQQGAVESGMPGWSRNERLALWSARESLRGAIALVTGKEYPIKKYPG